VRSYLTVKVGSCRRLCVHWGGDSHGSFKCAELFAQVTESEITELGKCKKYDDEHYTEASYFFGTSIETH
jgi:hypothetical protein